MDDGPDEVAEEVLAELRAICLGLPEVHEEAAWVGRRWQVRKRTFAHVFWADQRSSPAIRKVADLRGEGTFLVFRSSGDELDWLRNAGPPFAYAGWGRDVIAVHLEHIGWDEVAELLTESYCVMAPEKLRAQVDRPSSDEPGVGS